MLLHVAVGIGRSPCGHGVHLVNAALVALDDGDRTPGRGLITPTAVHPALHAFERRAQRLDLVDLAAEVGVSPVEIEPVAAGELVARHRRSHLAQLQAEARDDLVAVVERFREMKAGVEEHDRHPRRDRRQHVRERHSVVLEGAGEDHVRSEALGGPGENLLGRAALEPGIDLVEIGWRLLDRRVACRLGHRTSRANTRTGLKQSRRQPR